MTDYIEREAAIAAINRNEWPGDMEKAIRAIPSAPSQQETISQIIADSEYAEAIIGREALDEHQANLRKEAPSQREAAIRDRLGEVRSFLDTGFQQLGATTDYANDDIARVLAKLDAILAILDQPAPTPADALAEALRLEPIKALVDGAQWARNRLEIIADDAWHGDGRDLKRSIIGVFSDFDEALLRCGSSLPAALVALTEGR